MKNKTMITAIAIITLAITLATMTVAQMVVARSDDSPSRDQLEHNCQNGNSLACGALPGGNQAQPNERFGTINNCIPIPSEGPCLQAGFRTP